MVSRAAPVPLLSSPGSRCDKGSPLASCSVHQSLGPQLQGYRSSVQAGCWLPDAPCHRKLKLEVYAILVFLVAEVGTVFNLQSLFHVSIAEKV